ncbi:facilitated trehalose transporter Tret1-like [Leptopilina heterotoma]|uniref:facilitated trehalose transporter Tret1-like n=1 Tax=Leptopilina heterotoma TaxID=63436 RepID=UPI001CA9629D|nr:facilitated trehalose transporter Tret1-like [Leptopilina heterotoma]
MVTKRLKYWWKLFQTEDSKGIIAGLAAHSGQISVGLSQGFSAILIPKLLDTNFATVSECSWIASLGVISNPVGALMAGIMAEFFGRKSAIAVATLPHIAGWLIIAFSTSVPLLYAGRIVSGIGTGMANGLYLYVSEVAAPHQRAWLASIGPVMVSFGVLISYSLGAMTTWQNTAAISIAPAILSLALTRILPETPAWLATRGRIEEAKEALLWLRGPGLSTDIEHNELSSSVSNLKLESSNSNIFHSNDDYSKIWKPFLILLLFFALQQLSGIYIILFYAVSVLKDIGVSIDEYLGSVGIGAVRLLASIVGAALARNLGRKTLASISGLGMAASALGVALSVRFEIPSLLPLTCVASHVGFSMIGYLTLPWVMTSELYPLRLRGIFGGLTTSIAQILTFAAVKSYPDVNSFLGLESTMWTFSAAGLLGAVFAMTILPETRGRSLDQIETGFTSGQSKIKSSIVTEPKNVTLKNFKNVSEDKYPNMIANVYAYDNFTLDLTLDNVEKKNSQQNTKNYQNDPRLEISCIPVEKLYL